MAGIGKPRVGTGNLKVAYSAEGGLMIRLTNRTSSTTVKGTVVMAATGYDSAFDVAPADSDEPIGVVYENNIAVGDECWVVVSGIAEVLLQNSTASTRGYWARTSITVAGRADITNADTPGFAIQHTKEIGHCIESKSQGTNVLAKVILHFN